MIINILEYLERAQDKYAGKILYKDEKNEITFEDAFLKARRWGSFLAGYTPPRRPVFVVTDKTVTTPVLFLQCFTVDASTSRSIWNCLNTA